MRQAQNTSLVPAFGQRCDRSFTERSFTERAVLILSHSLRIVAAGIAIGLPLAIPTGGLYSALLFGVRPADLPTIAGVIALVSLVALAEAYIPSRRAARVDPSLCLALRMTRPAAPPAGRRGLTSVGQPSGPIHSAYLAI
jgi:hypothetical protein